MVQELLENRYLYTLSRIIRGPGSTPDEALMEIGF